MSPYGRHPVPLLRALVVTASAESNYTFSFSHTIALPDRMLSFDSNKLHVYNTCKLVVGASNAKKTYSDHR
jgi:hypothetical protein